MTVQLFNGMTDRSFLEPLATLVLRTSRGRPDFTDAAWQPQAIVLMAHARGGTEEHIRDVQALLEEHKGHVSHEMVIGFMLIAALAARKGKALPEVLGTSWLAGKAAVGKLSGLAVTQDTTPDADSLERAAEGFRRLAAGARDGRKLPERL